MSRAVKEPSRVEFELNESSLIDKVNDHFSLFKLEFVKNRVELELVANNSSRIEFESSRAVRENLISFLKKIINIKKVFKIFLEDSTTQMLGYSYFNNFTKISQNKKYI